MRVIACIVRLATRRTGAIQAVAAALALSVVHAGAAGESDLRVLCSNGIRGPMQTILAQAEKVIGRTIVIEYGPSAALRRTIDSGEAFDLAILTPQMVDVLVKSGKITEGTQTDLATTNLALGVRAGSAKTDIGTAAAIKRRLLAARSVTYTKEGASAAAVRDMLTGLGIASEIERKTVYQTVSGRPAESVADGENEIVFAPVSEILTVRGVEVLGLFPPEFQRPMTMTAGVGAKSDRAVAALFLVAFLRSDAAAAAMRAGGMEPAP
jgi:molybdate transport system substrate-binding protein